MTTKSHKQAIKAFEAVNYTCQYCNTQFSPDQPPLHIHHRVFKQMGKTNKLYEIEENKAVCCFKCHFKHDKLKGARLYTEKDFKVIKSLTKLILGEVI